MVDRSAGYWLKTEELLLLGLCTWVFFSTSLPWWYYPLFLFVPDISMLGYLANPAIGAFFYNLGHHRGLAALVLLGGWYIGNEMLVGAGAIWLVHISLDRLLGFGLKYRDQFKHTHLDSL